MNGVIGMTNLLLDTNLDNDQLMFTETIKTSSDSLLVIINDILDFSKIEAGKLELENSEFDLHQLLGDFADLMDLKIRGKKLELTSFIEPNVPSYILGDPGRLRQILINLTGNAIKFTAEGYIALRVSLENETEEGVMVRFSVRDTGIGIPDDKLESLFGQFTQVDASTTREYGGTGLGLAISKQLSEAMGGQIGVLSEMDRGSEFWFTALFQKQNKSTIELILPSALVGKRILIVDDNAGNRENIKVQLNSWGLRSETAENAIDALDKLQSSVKTKDPFTLVFIDLEMPEMDGVGLLLAIEKDVNLASTTLIMMRHLGSRTESQRLEQVRTPLTISKPVRQSTLFETILEALSVEKVQIAKPKLVVKEINPISGKNFRILLAEDNPVNQMVATRMLKKLGLTADVVENGKDAIKALADNSYDLILMDCQMPEMDGYKATKNIRDPKTNVPNHGIPIIAMTANAMQGDREKCLRAGMDDYLAKPINPKPLREMLDKWLKRV